MAEVPAALTPRQREILEASCRDYLVSGAPIASSALRSAHRFGWSAATIRQEFAALERLGYLQRAHHSAGRTPTPRAIEWYVGALPRRVGVRPELAHALDRGLDAGNDATQHMRATVRLLSEVSGCLAVSLVATSQPGVVRELELVPVAGTRVLLVVSLEQDEPICHAVDLPRPHADADAVRKLEDRLRWLCVGRTLEQARDRLMSAWAADEHRFDELLAVALRLGLVIVQGASLRPVSVEVAGQPSLVGNDAWPGTALAQILGLLEDYHRLAEVLCQLLPEPEAEHPLRVGVSLGPWGPRAWRLDADEPAFDAAVALLGCRITRTAGPGGTRHGALALLGPQRMDYEAAIPLVEYAARALATRMSVV